MDIDVRSIVSQLASLIRYGDPSYQSDLKTIKDFFLSSSAYIWPGNRLENFGPYEPTLTWPFGTFNATLVADKIEIKDSQGNVVASSGILDEPSSGIKVHPNGFTEYRDANGNVIMDAGTPKQREEVKQMSNWPTYSEMVRNLFKSDPVKTNMVMHAAIGLAGESGEMRAAKDYKEACEEAGDMIFYLEALRQQLPPNHGNVELLTEVTSSPYYRPSHATVVDNIHIITCEILDVAKKSWVYGREIDSFKLGWMIELLQIQLDYYCTEYLGLTVPGIKYQNQAKLMVRYEGGKYSNEAAIARKDKQ